MNAGKFYRTKEFILGGGVSLYNDDLKLALLLPGFLYNKNLVNFSNISALEVSPTLYYPAGGKIITGKDIYTDPVTGKAEFRIGSMQFDELQTDIRSYVVYTDIMAYGIQSPLLCYGVFDETLTFQLSPLKLSWPNPLMRW